MKDKIEQITQRIVEGADSIETVILQDVEVQANGIIRNSKGRLIARLVDSVDYEGEHIKGLNPMQNTKIKELISLYDWPGLAEAYHKQERSLNAEEWKTLFKDIRNQF